MSRMLLTSSSKFFYDNLGDYMDKPLDEVKVAWITTARRYSRTPEGIDEHRERLNKQLFTFIEVDLDGKKENELRETIRNCDVIFVIGGHTFELLRAIRESGFDGVVQEFLDRGGLYVGASAGAYVMCPTTVMATWKHQSVYKPLPEQDLTGLNVVPFLMTVHYESRHEEDVRIGMNKTDLETYILTDEQALYIEDGKVELKGGGKQVVL